MRNKIKKKFKPISTKGLSTYSIKSRKSKVNVEDFAGLPVKGGSFKDFLGTLPGTCGQGLKGRRRVRNKSA